MLVTRLSIFVSAALLFLASPCWGEEASDVLSFNEHIRPILSEHCFACHGFDAKKRQGGLRLDVAEGALAKSDSGSAAVVPNDLANSELWKRVQSADPDVVMPPPSTKKSLTDAQKELLRKWIEQGATYQKHWSFEKPQQVAPPAIASTDALSSHWSKQPIDQFLFAKMQSKGLKPRPEADKLTLIRRVAFTLTGLPPTPAEVAQFESDTSADAYEKMVDRYLHSPHYGEEMARHWLDVARYADTHGLHLDNERSMWAYRDWVVQAMNQNLPFDQFTTDQLAGDLLPNPTQEQLVATGFNRCNVTTSEGGAIAEEFLFRYAVDRTSTTVQTWLGMTGGCAVCHDHKYDPITAKDFYSLYAFFYSAADPAMDGNNNVTAPTIRLANAEKKQRILQLQQTLSDQRKQLDDLIGSLQYSEPTEGDLAVEDVWIDDRFPEGASVSCSSRNAAIWALQSELSPASGERSLKQASADNYEDRIENPTVAWIVGDASQVRVSVQVDRWAPPDALKLELLTSKGSKFLLWGNVARFGGANDKDRIRLGDIPAGAQWHSIEFPLDKFELKSGDRITGVKLAQFGGVAYWDQLKFAGKLKKQEDIRSSFAAWWKDSTGKDVRGVPGELAKLLKEGSDKNPPAEEVSKLKQFFLREIARPISDEHQAKLVAWLDAKRALAVAEESQPASLVFKDLDNPRQAMVMERGQYDKPGSPVEPAAPAFLAPLQGIEPGRRPNRLDLARWLLSEENPLTARVTVNRFWQQVFGTGLVKTSYDFGSQGERPSHPELLDWLAIWYRQNGWNTRELMRMMVNSAAFRQDSSVNEELLRVDPENRLLARGPRFRLDAEQVRDNALFVSGLMDFTMGGPGVNSYQPPNIWEPVGYSDSNTRFYLQDHGSALYRRSIYTFFKRTAPPPYMSNFDAPNREQFCTQRERSNTPLQALQLMNDTQHFEAARALAQRMILEGGASGSERIAFGYRVVLSRTARPEELELVTQALNHYLDRYQKSPEEAALVCSVGESRPNDAIAVPELAAYTLIGNLILNLDETVNRN